MHLDEELVERLRHRELATSAERAVHEHLASCDTCRLRTTEAEQEERALLGTLRGLDHAPPIVSVASIVARVQRQPSRRMRWVAAALALTFAGVAYASPGSPVRSWFREIVERYLVQPARHRAADEVISPAPSLPVAGIAVDPGVALGIVFETPRAPVAPSGSIVVMLVDSEEVVVRAPRGAATFTTDAERLAVEKWDASATFEILVPRSAPRVEIRLGGRTVFVKTGRDVSTTGVEREHGTYMIPLTPTPPSR